MLYLDGVSLSFLVQDMKEKLSKKKINRIFQTTETSLSLHFGKQALVLSCNPQLPICYISGEKETVLEDTVSSFLNALRKYLMNSMLCDIKQNSWDRSICFHFSRLTELGEYKQYYLIFEMMGRNSNLFLCDEKKKILEILKRFSLDEVHSRNLFPGAVYESLASHKISPLLLTKDTPKPYFQSVEGIGKLLSDALEEGEKSLEDYLQEPNIILYQKDGKNILLNFLGLSPKEFDSFLSFTDIQEAILYYLQSEKLFSSLLSLRKQLLLQLQRREKKVQEILKKIAMDEEKNANYQTWKEQGDILASVLYQIKGRRSQIEAYDFYHDRMISLELDLQKSPQENLEAYYKKYNKAKTTLDYASKRKEQMLEELDYLDSLYSFLEQAESIEVLKSIEEEMVQAQYIKAKAVKGKPKKKEKKYQVLSFPSFEIYYGRNNLENEFVSFQLAEKQDYWFHAKDIPGSHVILKAKQEITEEMIERASLLAAYFSKAKLGDKVQIDYTQKKFLKKPAASKPGFVIYNNEKSITCIKQNLEDFLPE